MKQIEALLLDEILTKILESKNNKNYSDFISSEYLKHIDEKDRSDEIYRLEHYIKDYNVARIIRGSLTEFISRNENTKNFIDNGGFLKIYQDELSRLEKEEERDILSMRKLKWDTKLSKWQVKTFWWVFVFGFFGFIFGLYNFIDNLNKTKSIEELKQSNQATQEEVSRLRTLVLDTKTVYPLHSSKTQIDSLRQR